MNTPNANILILNSVPRDFDKQTNLKRGGEAAHGDVSRLTTCHIEVRAAHFSWEIVNIIIIIIIYIIPMLKVYHQKYEW